MRKPGLWLSMFSCEVQIVTNRQHKKCDQCGKQPKKRRLSLKQGSGRSMMQSVLCRRCGLDLLETLVKESSRAARYLVGDETDYPIRLEKDDRRWPFDKIAKLKREAKKLKEAAEHDRYDRKF
jgi:hypothetical protein